MVWNEDSNDWQIGFNPNYTYSSVLNTAAGFIASGKPVILLEHDLRPLTVEIGQNVSQMIINAGNRLNCPIAALFGDAQPYQGTNLTWPIVVDGTYNDSSNPIKGVIGYWQTSFQ